jgi:hypothetical protein
MEVELYLRSIMQEHPDNALRSDQDCAPAGHPSQGDLDSTRAWGNWRFDWGLNKWRNGEPWAPEGGARRPLDFSTWLRLLRLRDEEFGGLAFDPTTTAVLKLDREGMEAIRAVRSETSPAGRLGSSGAEREDFLAKLRECAGLA